LPRKVPFSEVLATVRNKMIEEDADFQTVRFCRISSAAARRWLSAVSLSIVASYVLFVVLFARQTGPQDGDQYLVFHTLQYWNASMFGIAKQWTPLLCGGLSMAGEPQVPFMSLSMGLSYLLGPLWGVKSSTVIYFAAGWTGAFLYSGLWLRLTLQRQLAAALFVGNGFFACRLGMGHLDFIPFLALPLILWVLHGSIEWRGGPLAVSTWARLMLTSMLIGATFALCVDGSPVAIIHFLFWIGLYAFVLALTTRSARPLIVFSSAVALAIVLDAGYLWPMVRAQSAFPRLTADHFTSALSLVWFALLPIRGKVLPANGNGHELSVYIGPVLAYLIWKYRHSVSVSLPRDMKIPLIVVSLASVVLGMGSLKVLHLPTWLSPFDLLRPLPGFRSIGVTGRYWGFLALPLSLLSAAALSRYVMEFQAGWRLHTCLAAVLLFQLSFQIDTLSAHWFHSPYYRSLATNGYFLHRPEAIEYVTTLDNQQQGEVISPIQGVRNCYDMDDFLRAAIPPGHTLISGLMQGGQPVQQAPGVEAKFRGWSHIHLAVPCAISGDQTSCLPAASRTQIVLQQAYHSSWRAAGCNTLEDAGGHLALDCATSVLRRGFLDVHFDDVVSERAAEVSLAAWKCWLGLTVPLLLVIAGMKWRGRRKELHVFYTSSGVEAGAKSLTGKMIRASKPPPTRLLRARVPPCP
jgi:hypothetical protein